MSIFPKLQRNLMRTMAVFYTFASLFNDCLSRRLLHPRICFCVKSVVLLFWRKSGLADIARSVPPPLLQQPEMPPWIPQMPWGQLPRWSPHLRSDPKSTEDMYTQSASVHMGCYNKVPRVGGFSTMKFISHRPGGWKSGIREPVWLGSRGDPLPGCRLLTSCILTWQWKSKRFF